MGVVTVALSTIFIVIGCDTVVLRKIGPQTDKLTPGKILKLLLW